MVYDPKADPDLRSFFVIFNDPSSTQPLGAIELGLADLTIKFTEFLESVFVLLNGIGLTEHGEQTTHSGPRSMSVGDQIITLLNETDVIIYTCEATGWSARIVDFETYKSEQLIAEIMEMVYA